MHHALTEATRHQSAQQQRLDELAASQRTQSRLLLVIGAVAMALLGLELPPQGRARLLDRLDAGRVGAELHLDRLEAEAEAAIAALVTLGPEIEATLRASRPLDDVFDAWLYEGRGWFFFDAMRRVAAAQGAVFNWRVATVPGVGHSNAGGSGVCVFVCGGGGR